MITLRIASSTKVGDAAGAVAGQLREHQIVQVQAIGAAAVNQAVKSLALAELYMLDDGFCVASRVRMMVTRVGNKDATVVQWLAWRAPAPESERNR